MDTSVTLSTVCLTGSTALTNNICFTTTDTTIWTTVPTAVESVEVWGTITVGSTATQLNISFGCTTLATTNAETILVGSFIYLAPTVN